MEFYDFFKHNDIFIFLHHPKQPQNLFIFVIFMSLYTHIKNRKCLILISNWYFSKSENKYIISSTILNRAVITREGSTKITTSLSYEMKFVMQNKIIMIRLACFSISRYDMTTRWLTLHYLSTCFYSNTICQYWLLYALQIQICTNSNQISVHGSCERKNGAHTESTSKTRLQALFKTTEKSDGALYE